jgi:hypothetical protein
MFPCQDGSVCCFGFLLSPVLLLMLWQKAEAAEERLLAAGSDGANLSSAAVPATQRTDPIKLKREVN